MTSVLRFFQVANRLCGSTARAAWLVLTLALVVGLAAGSLVTSASGTVLGLASAVVETVAKGRSVRAETERSHRLALSRAEQRAAAQADEISALRSRLARQGDEIVALERRLALAAAEPPLTPALRRQVSDAVDRIVARSVRVQAANLGSMAGEALPFLGVAVIAAATAYEVKSTCETVQDLQALERAFNPDRVIDDREVCGLQVPTAAELWATVRDGPGLAWSGARDFFTELPEMDWSLTYRWLLDAYDWVAASLWQEEAPA